MPQPSRRHALRLASASLGGLLLCFAGCARRGGGHADSAPPPQPVAPAPASSAWGSPDTEPRPAVGSPGSGRDDAHAPTKGIDPTQMGTPDDPRMGKPPVTSPIDTPVDRDAGAAPLELPPRPAP